MIVTEIVKVDGNEGYLFSSGELIVRSDKGYLSFQEDSSNINYTTIGDYKYWSLDVLKLVLEGHTDFVISQNCPLIYFTEKYKWAKIDYDNGCKEIDGNELLTIAYRHNKSEILDFYSIVAMTNRSYMIDFLEDKNIVNFSLLLRKDPLYTYLYQPVTAKRLVAFLYLRINSSIDNWIDFCLGDKEYRRAFIECKHIAKTYLDCYRYLPKRYTVEEFYVKIMERLNYE